MKNRALQSLRRRWSALDPRQAERAQMAALRHFLDHVVLPFSPHYRDQAETIDTDKLASRDDLQRIPLSSKADLLGGSEVSRRFVVAPEPSVLARRPGVLLHGLVRGRGAAREALAHEFRPLLMTSTTGRSSEPVPFLYTGRDLDNLALAGSRLMEICESRQEFRHLNVFPFAPHLAFWQMHYAGLGFHTFCLSTGGGKTMGTKGNVRLIERVKPDALIGMPTFVYHLLQAAARSDIRLPNLCRIVLGGEKVPAGLRSKLRALSADLGAHDVSVIATYGFTEAKTAWPECPVPAGSVPTGFHLYPDFGIVEIIDPDSGEPVPEGSPGEIVYTPLDARGTVVLRYRTGDLSEGGLTHAPCPRCGRIVPRLLGRISRVSNQKSMQLSKLKGTLVDLDNLEHILDDAPGLGTWQIELRKKDDDPLEVDEIVVRAEALDPGDADALKRSIRDRFLTEAEVTPNAITFHSAAEMRRIQGVGSELKEARLIDRRPSGAPAHVSHEPPPGGAPGSEKRGLALFDADADAATTTTEK
ncbi:phenylacetate--CoA ligase [soil metagenome]